MDQQQPAPSAPKRQKSSESVVEDAELTPELPCPMIVEIPPDVATQQDGNITPPDDRPVPSQYESLLQTTKGGLTMDVQSSPLKRPEASSFPTYTLEVPIISFTSSFPPKPNKFYVDKTPFIAYICNTPRAYIVGPRRFGKSMAMKMVREFISVHSTFDWNSNVLTVGSSLNLDTGSTYSIMNREKFKKAHEKFYKQFHVLYFDFSRLRKTTFEDCKENYIEMLKVSLRQWMKAIFDQKSKFQFENLINSIDGGQLKSYSNVICQAIEILSIDFEKSNDSKSISKRPIFKFAVLIDEFEAPFIASQEHNYLKSFSQFIDDQFCSFKDTDFVQLIYLTGVQEVGTIHSSFAQSGFIKDFTVNSVFSIRAADYFGFTESEIESIVDLAYSNENARKETKNLLHVCYDGYLSDDRKNIYNPWSITQALGNGVIGLYWTCSDSKIAAIDNSFCDMGKYSAVKQLSRLLTNPENKPTITDNDLGQRLLKLGLVTRKVTKLDEIDSSTGLRKVLTEYFIPNTEVRESIIDYINKKIFGVADNIQDQIVSHLANKDIEQFIGGLKVFHDGLSVNFNKEYSYQVSLYVLLNMDRKEVKDVEMEGPSGSGRYDVRIDFPDHKVAYIFELKLIPHLKDLTIENSKKSAEEGLSQINDRQYWKYYTAKKGKAAIDTLFMVGISFHRSSLYAAYQEWAIQDGKLGETSSIRHIPMME